MVTHHDCKEPSARYCLGSPQVEPGGQGRRRPSRGCAEPAPCLLIRSEGHWLPDLPARVRTHSNSKCTHNRGGRGWRVRAATGRTSQSRYQADVFDGKEAEGPGAETDTAMQAFNEQNCRVVFPLRQ